MRHVVFDMGGLSRWQRWKIRWEVRRMGARAIHSPHVLERTAVVFDPEEAEERLRRDLMSSVPSPMMGVNRIFHSATQEQAAAERRAMEDYPGQHEGPWT